MLSVHLERSPLLAWPTLSVHWGSGTMEDMKQVTMWSDNETTIDLIGYDHLIGAVTAIVKNDALLPASVGVFGDWGSGKSSVLRMVEADLKRDEKTLVLHFNGWLFEDYEDAKSALLGTLLDGIGSHTKLGEKAKDVLCKLLRRLDYMKLAGGAARFGVSAALGGLPVAALLAGASVKDLIVRVGAAIKDGDTSVLQALLKDVDEETRVGVREFRRDFQELLEKTAIERLVVLIDDLDRCLPDTVIETLEAIKLFVFVPRTAFVIAADERLIEYAVRKRFPELPGDKAEVGRDYLEKLIQYPVRIPPLGRSELETYINVLFASAAGLSDEQLTSVRDRVTRCDERSLLGVRFNTGIARELIDPLPKRLQDDLAFSEQIAPTLAAGTAGLNGNPRQCKRFLNTLVLRLEMARARGITLRREVLAKLMLLEWFAPITFKALAQASTEQDGDCTELKVAERQYSQSDDLKSQHQPLASPRTPADGTDGSGKKGSESASLGDAVEPEPPEWLSDAWVCEWLALAPGLTGVDLRPYFFFSRDTLGTLGVAVQRLSPAAQEVLSELFSDSEAQRNLALDKTARLTQSEVSSLFNALAERSRREADPGDERSAMFRLCDLATRHAYVAAPLIAFLAAVPDLRIPLAVVSKIRALSATPETQSTVLELLTRWSQSSGNSRLAAAARSALQRRTGGGGRS